MTRRRGGLICVPYIGAYPDETVAALKGHQRYGWALSVEPVGPEEHAYFDKLNQLWSLCAMGNTDLLVVEGDVVIHDTVLDQFDDCPNDYCTFCYWIGASYGYGLGCTRFRAKLIAKNPDLIRVAGERVNDGIPKPYTWKRMDTRIRDEARERGLLTTYVSPGDVRPCIHEPPVRHLHPYAMPEPSSPEAEFWEHARFRQEHADG